MTSHEEKQRQRAKIQAEVIRLRDAGLTFAEIAKSVGGFSGEAITGERVRQIYHRATNGLNVKRRGLEAAVAS